MGRLLTPQQLVDEFNLPSVRTIRTLRAQGLPTVKLGAARLTDYDDMVAFIERKKETIARPVPARPAGRVRFQSSAEQTQAAYERLLGLAYPKGKPPKPR